MSIRVRLAQMSDLDAVQEVEERCFSAADAATREQMRERLRWFSDWFWLAFDGDRLVAYIGGMPSRERDLRDEMFADATLADAAGRHYMVFSVATIPEYQHLGVAGIVMRKVLEDCRARGCDDAVLTCKEHLVGFYARFGYEDEGLSASEHGGAIWHQMRLAFPSVCVTR